MPSKLLISKKNKRGESNILIIARTLGKFIDQTTFNLDYLKVVPPSTIKVWPVIQFALSEHKNKQAPARS